MIPSNQFRKESNSLEFFQSFVKDFFPGINLSPSSMGGSPRTNILESDDQFVIQLEIPGIKKESVSIELEGNELSITSKSETKEEKNLLRREFRIRDFDQKFRIPSKVDPHKIKASFKEGILEIQLVKKEEEQKKHKKIEVL